MLPSAAFTIDEQLLRAYADLDKNPEVSEEVRSRIHRLVFCASDALGCLGGVAMLKERFDLVPHLLSGKLSSSPLACRELAEHCDLPMFDSLERNAGRITELLV